MSQCWQINFNEYDAQKRQSFGFRSRRPTTRDYIKEEIHLNGFPVLLYDTAGIRDTKDKIETAGIEKTTDILKECDIQLFLISEIASIPIIENQLDKNRPFLIYLNKADVLSTLEKSQIKEKFKEKNIKLTNELSLFDKKSVELIENDLLKIIEKEFQFDKESLLLLGERQKKVSDRIVNKLKKTFKSFKS